MVIRRDQAGRPTQARKRSREGPVRTEKRARQQERPVTPTQAPRPAPGISKKARRKNEDGGGQMPLSRAAPRPTRDIIFNFFQKRTASREAQDRNRGVTLQFTRRERLLKDREPRAVIHGDR